MNQKPVLAALVATVGLLIASAPAAIAADRTVTGLITVSGKPLAAGRIIYHFCDGQFVGAGVTDGSYTVNRVPVGVLKVTFEGDGVPERFTSPDSSPFCVVVRHCTNTINFCLPSVRPVELAPGEIAEFFYGNDFDHDRWRISESTEQTQFQVQDGALVTTVAPSFKGVAVCMQHVEELTGDFEVRCDLQVLESPVIEKGWINLELVLIGADGQFHSMMGLDRDLGSRFSALYMPSRAAVAAASTRKYTFVSVKQTGTKGTLCLRRIGTEVIVGIIRDGEFVETKRLDCDATPMRLRTQCFMRERMPGPTRFRFDNLRIRPLPVTQAQ